MCLGAESTALGCGVEDANWDVSGSGRTSEKCFLGLKELIRYLLDNAGHIRECFLCEMEARPGSVSGICVQRRIQMKTKQNKIPAVMTQGLKVWKVCPSFALSIRFRSVFCLVCWSRPGGTVVNSEGLRNLAGQDSVAWKLD